MNKLADDIERLCCAETEGKFFDLVTDSIGEIIAALRGVSQSWECMGRKQSLPEPGECNWPDCGCDPHTTKVIESLLEQGWCGPQETSTLRAQLAADVAALNRQAQILKANDERWEQVHDIVQQARELVRLHIVYDARPPGLFQKLQDALYAIRGRAALTSG